MKLITKGAAIAALAAIGFTASATAASAAPKAPVAAPATITGTPILDSPGYASPTSNCTPGVTTHTVYKWVPDVASAGPTMWTVNDATANAPATFQWKGVGVAYHRDGTKTSQATDLLCLVPVPVPVSAPQFSVANGTGSCSVTVPYTVGLDTRLYGVNGYPQENPITADTTVTAGLAGSFGTAPQFWIGYTAKPGFVLEGAPGTSHIDFYNGDDIADCTAAA